MFQRYFIRLLTRSTLTKVNAENVSLSSQKHLFYFNQQHRSQNYFEPIFCLNISHKRCFTSESKTDFENQLKNAELLSDTTAANIPDTEETEGKDTSLGTENKTASSESKNVDSFTEMEQKSEFKSPVVFMRGLPYSSTKEDVIQFFSPLGIEPTKVFIKSDRYGHTNGKAEVEFATAEDATAALKKQNHYMGNRYIELSMQEFPLMNADRVTGKMAGRYRDEPFRESFYADSSMGFTVKLAGLPYQATADDVREFFSNLNIKPTEINVKYGFNGESIGLCFVKFQTKEEAVESLKNNNKYIGNRYIRVTMMRSSQGPSREGISYDENERGFSRSSDRFM